MKKLFGGITMTYWKVLIMALLSAVVSAAVLLVKPLENTSFVNIGVCFEAWIFLAMIIITNCKKETEAAVKTFIFFLVSQPLIYLFQVPFNEMGFRLFMYYKGWFIWTLLTIPGAMIAYQIKRKNLLHFVGLLPVVGFLILEFIGHFRSLTEHFPFQLFTCIFIILQVAVYIGLFAKDKVFRIVEWCISGLIIVLIMLNFLIPSHHEAVYSIRTDDKRTLYVSEGLSVSVEENGYVCTSSKNGQFSFTVEDDQENIYNFSVDFSRGKNSIELR